MDKAKKLLFSLNSKDFEWEFFTSSGAGGQHRNRVKTACRCRHVPSNSVAVATEHKSQLQNKQAAFTRCCESQEFQRWCKTEASRRLGNPSPEEVVDQMMENVLDFKIEVKDNQGRWQEISLEDFLILSE